MKGLLLVDIQNDFLPSGALPVPRGDEVVPVANRLMATYGIVVACQDWHPSDHLSFASQHPGKSAGDVAVVDGLEQILWPDHCVQGTRGADFAEGLNVEAIAHVVQKGTDRRTDSYSGFFDNARRNSTGLENYLRDQGVNEVDVVGLATDYCVKFTALDAADLGFRTAVLGAVMRGVERQPGDCAAAMQEMRNKGVQIVDGGPE